MCRVDIIMTTYNGEKFLREQLESIRKSKGCKVYLHVFDDGSTDGTLNILNDYKLAYPGKVEVYQNKTNLGVTQNFLYGIRKVMEYNHEGQYFMFSDQDDVWLPDKIERTLKRMIKMEERYGAQRPLLAFTDATVVNDNLERLHPSFHESQHLSAAKTDLAHLLMENKCIGCTIMINRAFEPYLMRLPKKARYHDWWLALIAAAFGNISYINRATMLYRQHENNIVGGTDFTFYIKNRINHSYEQKESLHRNESQAREFYDIFRNIMPIHKRLQVEEFIEMFSDNFLKRRIKAVTAGYLKSGLIRNIGLMLYL